MLIDQNAPDLVIIAAAVVMCLISVTLPSLALWYRFGKVRQGYDDRMERIQNSFGALWDYANEKGLMEHAEHDKKMTAQLEEVRLSIYGAGPTPKPSQTKIPRPVRPALSPRRIRKTGRR